MFAAVLLLLLLLKKMLRTVHVGFLVYLGT